MSNGTRWALILLGALVLVVSTYLAQRYVARPSGQTGNFLSPPDPSVVIPIILIVAVTLLGIACHYLFEKLKNATADTIDVRAELSAMASSRQFWMALLVSPLTFNATYVLIGQNSDTIAIYLLAFQNGFFWESIIDGLVNRNPETLAAGASPGAGVAGAGSGRG